MESITKTVDDETRNIDQQISTNSSDGTPVSLVDELGIKQQRKPTVPCGTVNYASSSLCQISEVIDE